MNYDDLEAAQKKGTRYPYVRWLVAKALKSDHTKEEIRQALNASEQRYQQSRHGDYLPSITKIRKLEELISN